MNMIKFDLANQDYHAGEGVSKSGLDVINKSPAHFYAKYIDPNRPPAPAPTPAMIAGTLAHCAILEPEEFAKRYVVAPEGIDRRTKSGKEAWEQFQLEAGSREVITAEQLARAFSQAASVRKIQDAADLLAVGSPEVSAYWTDEDTGLLCKCRPDWVSPCRDGGMILLDVKTTTDASPREFSRSIAKWRYHVQAAWYSDGYEKASGATVHGFMFVVVENEYPYSACAYMLDDLSLDRGRNEYGENIKLLSSCMQTGQWPGYSNEIEVLSLPQWAFKE